MIANVTSHRPGKDESCVLEKGDHPCITHKSVVNYREARLVASAGNQSLEQLLKRGNLIQEERVSDAILERIRRGATVSRWIPKECRQFLAGHGLLGGS